jgi:hypothetical protein
MTWIEDEFRNGLRVRHTDGERGTVVTPFSRDGHGWATVQWDDGTNDDMPEDFLTIIGENPILAAFRYSVRHNDEDNWPDPVTTWLWYLETGNQEVSWEDEHIRIAWKVLTRLWAIRAGKPYPEDAPGPMYANDEDNPDTRAEATPTGLQLVVWVESPLTGEDEYKLLTALGGVVQATGERSRDVTVKFTVEEVPV